MVWKPHLTVASIVEQADRYLFVEECIDGRLVLNQPAGHVEDGEPILDAVVRETLEETGWDVVPEAVVGVYRWRHPDGETFIRVCVSARPLRHHPERPLDEDIRGAVWLSAEDLRAQAERHRSPLVWRVLEDYRQGRYYPLQLLQDLGDKT